MESDELERRAVTLVRQYRWAIKKGGDMWEFFQRMANFLGWENLKKELK